MLRPLKKQIGASLLVLCILMAGPASVQAQSSDARAAAASEVRFQQLEKEIRRLTGQVEEQNFKIRQLEEELARQTGDLSVRLDDLQGGGATGGGMPPAPSMEVAPNYGDAITPEDAAEPPENALAGREEPGDSFYTPPQDNGTQPGTRDAPDAAVAGGQLGTLSQSPEGRLAAGGSSEAAEYERAYALIKSRDFAAAESAFAAFIEKYPQSTYMTNAKYWYGETYYVRGNYAEAAKIFAESYQSNPKGSKAAGNLLKLGMSLAGLGKTSDACVAFKQLKQDYAASAVPILKRADTEMRKINCR